MAGFTNRGKKLNFDSYFRGATLPSNFYVALVTSAVTPTADTNTFSELTEIVAGNGYVTGGFELNPDSTDFDTLTEDDGNDRVDLLIKDITWTAGGGTIPLSGDGARYAVMTDDNATIASREIVGFWDLTSDQSVPSGGTFTLQDLELRGTE